MRFLLIEDNQALANAVIERLSLDSHIVDHAADLTTAWDYTATAEYDLILLDIMLPDGDGRSFLEQQRSAKSRTPVIVLTARSEVSDRVGILDLGADDYMVKPIDFSELEARCRAVLRRQTGAAQNTISFGEIEFDSLGATLKVNGTEVKLRTKELRLFEVFINAPNQIFPKSQLLDRLFSYDVEASENAIEVYVGRLRKHLSGSNVSITTVRGLGYKLECR
jgi:DNA-binding response OmpR family regulator